jgi:hypothetical protein
MQSFCAHYPGSFNNRPYRVRFEKDIYIDQEINDTFKTLFWLNNPKDAMVAFLKRQHDGCCVVIQTSTIGFEYIVINDDIFGFRSKHPIRNLFHTIHGSIAFIENNVVFLEKHLSSENIPVIYYEHQNKFSETMDWKSGDAIVQFKKKPSWLKSVFISEPIRKSIPVFDPTT